MARIRDIFARPSAWLGLLGLLLFAGALGWTGYDALVPQPAAACPELKPGGPADRMRILDMGSPELVLRGSLCLIVDNVVPEAAVKARQALAATARLDAAQAQPTPPAALPAQSATVVRYRTRYGYAYRRSVPAAALVPAAAAPDAALRSAAAAAKAVAADAALAQLTAPRKLVLFLDGKRSPAEPRLVRGLAEPQAVTFELRAESDAANADSAYWRRLLGGRSEAGRVPVTIGIGAESDVLPAATLRMTPARNGGLSAPIAFRVYRPAILWLAGLGLFLMLIGLVGIAQATPLLRDGRSRYSQYSLARVQMAWWFALTIAGFVYIWLVTGQYLGVIGSATFVLLGIAGATAGAARVVAGPKPASEPTTHGFLADIAGGDRVELHRLQMIAWTFVLGAIYLYNVLAGFTLAQFDANLLALAGVVNGVYVGLKAQET